MKRVHNSTTFQTILITDAEQEGRRWRNLIKRGDISVGTAFHESYVGYPYMTEAEYVAAYAAFVRAAE